MTTVAHALSASVIAVTAFDVSPSRTGILVAALAAGALADLDHIYPVLRNWRFYREHGFRGQLHNARTPVHELPGLLAAAIVAALLAFTSLELAAVLFTAFAVHLAQDFVTGHSLPLNPVDRTVVRMFDLTFAQKVAVDASVIAASVITWILYLRGLV